MILRVHRIFFLKLLRSPTESGDRHRAERVQKLGGAVVSVLDRSGREDVRLHQPRCYNASAYGLRGYVDNTLPSRCYASP